MLPSQEQMAHRKTHTRVGSGSKGQIGYNLVFCAPPNCGGSGRSCQSLKNTCVMGNRHSHSSAWGISGINFLKNSRLLHLPVGSTANLFSHPLHLSPNKSQTELQCGFWCRVSPCDAFRPWAESSRTERQEREGEYCWQGMRLQFVACL